MKYFLILFVLGFLCRSTLSTRLDNPVLYDFERRLVRLEARQFSESENIEHRMLQLENQLTTQQGEETRNPNLIAITEEKQPSAEKTFLQRLEELEKSWEMELAKQLAKISAKYENLSEKFSAIEKHVEETQMKDALNYNNKVSDPLKQPKDITHEDEEENYFDYETVMENGSGDGESEMETGGTLVAKSKTATILRL